MYYYIVNPAAGNGAIDGIQEKLKGTLHQLKIDGEFAKTLGEGDAAHITNRALARGVKTLVAVGGDDTIHEIIETLHHGKQYDVALGIIPIGKHNTLANHLGLTGWRQACDVLSVRRLSDYQLMQCNEDVFIYNARFVPVTISDEETTESASEVETKLSFDLKVDDNYRVQGTASELTVYNQKFLDTDLENKLVARISSYIEPSGPPGILKRLFKRAVANQSPLSQLQAERLTLKFKKPVIAKLDGRSRQAANFELSFGDRSLKLITAREAAEGRAALN